MAFVPKKFILTTIEQPAAVARKGHSATVLSDGKVLIVGGENQNGFVTEAEIFDPSTGSFSFSGNLNIPRADHSATRLSDGRVLIAGGRGDLGSLNSTEIFDPTTGVFTAGPDLTHSRLGPSATLQSDGRVLLAGGDGAGTLETYNPDSNSFSLAGASLNSPRSFHSAALMLDGRILFVGGRDADGNSLSSGEVFDSANENCSSVDSTLTVARVRPHLRVLFDRKVQVIGGSDDGSLEVYDPQINAFGAYAHVAPEGDTCAGLPAQVQGSQTRAALFHNGQSDETFDRSSHTMSELGTQATVVGGANSTGTALSSAPLFNSSNAEISTDKLDYAPGQTVYITGRGFEPGETVRIKVHEDPHTPLERGMDVVADADGNFVGEYVVQTYDLNMRFLVGSRGLTSGRTAQTTFTDARTWTYTISPNSTSVGTLTSFTLTVTNTGANCALNNDSLGSFETTIPAEFTLGAPTITAPGTKSWTVTVAGQLVRAKATSGVGGDKLCQNESIVITLPATATTAVGSPFTWSGSAYNSLSWTVASIFNAPTGGQPTVSVTACAAPTSATLLPASQTLTVGDTLTLNATVTGGTAPYNFVYKQGSTTVATHNNVNSTADSYTKTNIATTDAGSYTVEVTSNGCAGSGTATSGAASVTVNKRTASIAVSFLANPITYGGDTTVTATVTDTNTGTPITPTGTVTFSSDSGDSFSSTTCGLVAGVTGTASCSVTVTPTQASVHNISAAWPGDDAHSAPTDGSAGLTVNPKPVTANITVSNKTYDGNTTATITACTLSGVVSPDGTAEVDCSFGSATANFLDADAGTGKTVNASGLTLTGTKTSSYSFDGTASATANIDKAPVTATAGSYSGTYDGSAHPTTACAVTGVYTGGLTCTNSPSSVGPGVSSGAVTATVDQNIDNFDVTYVAGSFSITQAGSTVTVNCPASVVYNGTAQEPCTASWTSTGADGETAALTPSYSNNTNVGTATASATFDGDVNHTGSSNSANFQITKAPVTATAGSGSNVYDAASHSPSACVVSGTYTGDLTCANNPATVGPNVATYPISAVVSGTGLTNFEIAYVAGSYTITKAPTYITPDSNVDGVNNDCTNNTYTATLTDGVTGQDLGGINLKMTIGSQNTSADTNGSELATFTLTLFQAPGVVTQKFELNQPWTDPNRFAPGFVTRNFEVIGDPLVGPGTDADALYTGSLFFWTTSSTSSTATLTLSATIKDAFDLCPTGDITKAKISFLVSTNGGSSWNPVSNAQNLPVGLVNPNEPNVGTASAISQYNIGSNQSITLLVRVVVGGYYSLNTPVYDVPVTIGKPGLATSLMGGGRLKNDGIPFFASGYFGLNSISAEFGTQVQYNKKGTNPQGQVTVNVKSCNDRFGNREPGCTKYTPAKWHHYFIKSNSISELSLIGGSASFGSKTNVSEVLSDGSKISLDGGNTMQLIFTPYNQTAPPGSFVATSGVVDSSGKCTAANGCASIVIFRSAGGVWYSSSWGQGSGAAPRTYLKKVVNGTVVVAGIGSSTPTISAATGETVAAPSTATITPSAPASMNGAPEPQSTSTFVGGAVIAGDGSLKENVPGASAPTGDVVPPRRFFAGRAEAINDKTETVFLGDGGQT